MILPNGALELRVDCLDGEATRALITRHLGGMRAISPAEACHVFDVDALRHPSITFWSAWSGGALAGIGALKDLGGGRGEVKSMRVDDHFRGTGVGRAILRHLLATAKERGWGSLWLETGTSADFLPAIRLYQSEGFVRCGPFGDYREHPFSQFMTRSL